MQDNFVCVRIELSHLALLLSSELLQSRRLLISAVDIVLVVDKDM